MRPLAGLLSNLGTIHSRVFSPYNIQTGSGTHPAASSIGSGGLSPVLKMPGHKAGYPTASSSEVLKEWSYTSNTQYTLMTHQETHLPLDVGSMLHWNISKTFQSAHCNTPEDLNLLQYCCEKHRLCKNNNSAYRWLSLHGNVEWCSNTVSGHYEISVITPSTYVHGSP